mmetsp:Transcript_40364/g.67326  ORF Transcript_40364/g.67326 Transcript_40364/m.67326 type:complete len:200 (+) Transcript_40364:1653-2252(+)
MSVTRSVRLALWKKAASTKGLPTSSIFSTAASISADHGAVCPTIPWTRIPRSESGRLMGQLHVSGTAQTWALGYFRAKVMMGSLCSRAKVGSMMYRTGPSASSCARNSAVGKTGACTHRAPSDSLTAVQRMFTVRAESSWFCSKPQIEPGTSSVQTVRRSPRPMYGVKMAGAGRVNVWSGFGDPVTACRLTPAPFGGTS